MAENEKAALQRDTSHISLWPAGGGRAQAVHFLVGKKQPKQKQPSFVSVQRWQNRKLRVSWGQPLLFLKKMLYSSYCSLCASTSGVCGMLQRIKASSSDKNTLEQIQILHHQATIYTYIWDGCHWALPIQIIKDFTLCFNWFCALIFPSKKNRQIPSGGGFLGRQRQFCKKSLVDHICSFNLLRKPDLEQKQSFLHQTEVPWISYYTLSSHV